MKNFLDSLDFLQVIGGLLALGLAAFLMISSFAGHTIDPQYWALFLGLLAALGVYNMPSPTQTQTLKVALQRPLAVLPPYNQPRVMSGCGVSDQVLPKSVKTCDASPATGQR
jgi:hypothetical protein